MSTEEHAGRIGPFRAAVRGLIRRMVVTLSGGPRSALWQVLGFTNIPGESAETSDETLTVEPFLGIGFYARPASDGKPEAIVVNVGGSNAPAIVAVRDEKTRKAIAGAIAAGETMVFSPLAVVYLKTDGTVEIRSPSGVAKALVTVDEFNAHTHPYMDLSDGGDVERDTDPPSAVTGTEVLKGE